MEPQTRTRLSQAKEQLLNSCLGGKLRLSRQGNSHAGIPKRIPGAVLHLSFNQEQILTHLDRIGDKPAYNELITIHRHGPLDLNSLERAFGEMNRRHEIWRSTFAMGESLPIQIVHDDPPPVSLRLFDLRSRPKAVREKESRRLAAVNAHEKFNLSTLPLWQAILVQVDENEFQIHISLHHMVCDGVSVYHIILPELVSLYQAFSHNQPSPLPEPRVQYADFCIWQRAHVTQKALGEHLDWWKEKLAGPLPRLTWPGGSRRPAVQSFNGATEVLRLPAQTVESLRIFADRESATLFMALAAGFFTLLSRYTGETDLVLGMPLAGRPTGAEEIMGYFVNPLPVRVNLSGDPAFREVLLRVRTNVLGALEHGSVPLTHLSQSIRPAWDPSRNPIFQIMISLQPSVPGIDAAWDVTQADVSSGSTKMDLYFNLEKRPDGLRASVAYNPDLLDAPAVRRMFADWRSILESGIENPEQSVSKLNFKKSSAKRVMNWFKR